MIMILFICVGFLSAVLWVDLKFDWLAVPYRGKPGILPEDVLAPMTYFYRYVTGKPVAVAAAMILIVTTLVLEIAQATVPAWMAWASLVMFVVVAVRSSILVIPTARRFGQRTDTLAGQTRLAHTLLGMHMFAFVLLLLVGALQLCATWHPSSIPLDAKNMTMILFICVGFVIAIGWINLKFDLLAVPYRGKPGPLPEEVLSPIALFHRYLKSALQLGAAIVLILLILIIEVVLGSVPGWVAWISLVLFGAGMAVPVTIIRSARQLGARVDSLEKQTGLAHGLFPGHLFAFVMILVVGMLQLYAAWY